MASQRVTIRLTPHLVALLDVESIRAGESVATSLRRAVGKYYSEHQYTAEYQAAIERIARKTGKE